MIKLCPSPRRQCKACPWKKSTVPTRDIPDGYSTEKHAALIRTIATPENLGFVTPFRLMACHETPEGAERPCVGWLHNQLGVGNNIALRLIEYRSSFGDLVLDGPQHETFEETLCYQESIESRTPVELGSENMIQQAMEHAASTPIRRRGSKTIKKNSNSTGTK